MRFRVAVTGKNHCWRGVALLGASLAGIMLGATVPAAAQPRPPAPVALGMMPPGRALAVVADAGLDPVGVPARIGPRYVVRAEDGRGAPVRVVVDGRSGRILSVAPAASPWFAGRMVGFSVGPGGFAMYSDELAGDEDDAAFFEDAPIAPPRVVPSVAPRRAAVRASAPVRSAATTPAPNSDASRPQARPKPIADQVAAKAKTPAAAITPGAGANGVTTPSAGAASGLPAVQPLE